MNRLQFFERITNYANSDRQHSVDCTAESEGQECCLVKGYVLEFLWQEAVLHARQSIETDDPFGMKKYKYVNMEADDE